MVAEMNGIAIRQREEFVVPSQSMASKLSVIATPGRRPVRTRRAAARLRRRRFRNAPALLGHRSDSPPARLGSTRLSSATMTSSRGPAAWTASSSSQEYCGVKATTTEMSVINVYFRRSMSSAEKYLAVRLRVKLAVASFSFQWIDCSSRMELRASSYSRLKNSKGSH